MAVSEEQQKFLEQLALRIPQLFEAIHNGNVKSEYIVGVRRIGQRHVQLKLVAEVVDSGPNPLQTHGMLAPLGVSLEAQLITGGTGVEPDRSGPDCRQASTQDNENRPSKGPIVGESD